MPDDLRTRIAAVLVDAGLWDFGVTDDKVLPLADAVIAELGLRLQRDIDGDNEPRGLQPQHRYVTEWEVDE